MADSARLELGIKLAAYSTLLRAEGQGVAELGADAALTLARLYLPASNTLWPGFHRGRKVWDTWAVHAFAVWGCRHLDIWPNVFHGFDRMESPDEEALGNASLQHDPAVWRAAHEEARGSGHGLRGDEMLALWAWEVLGDRDLTREHIADLSGMKNDYAFLLAADLQSRLGCPPDEIRATLKNAERFCEKNSDWLSLAEAWTVHLDDAEQTARCLQNGNYDWDPQYLDQLVAKNRLALLLKNRGIVEASLRRWAINDSDSSASLELATQVLFFTGDKSLARRGLEAAEQKRSRGYDAYLLASAWTQLFDAPEKALPILRTGAPFARTREELHEWAWSWLDETGDRLGAKELLIAAKPRAGSCRPPHQYLEWVVAVLNILGDRDLAAEGIREAECRARHDDFHSGYDWDKIAAAWMKIERPDEARRVLGEALAATNTLDFPSLAKAWLEFFGDRKQAKACLDAHYIRLSKSNSPCFADLLTLAAAYLNLPRDFEKSAQLLEEAELLAENEMDAARLEALRERLSLERGSG